MSKICQVEYILEVIAFNIQSCTLAQQAGANRIELCASPGEGGTTPSHAFISAARKILRIPLYVMIRPRGGDFLYSDQEFRIMEHDIDVCKTLGADGVVLGILSDDGNVDQQRTARLVERAWPMGVTFHRAFDRVADYKKSIADVIATGCERVLTSGLHPTCSEGASVISELIHLAGNDIVVMPGSGVRSSNIREVIRKTGAHEIHSSAMMQQPSQMEYTNDHMNESLQYASVDTEEVAKMVGELAALSAEA